MKIFTISFDDGHPHDAVAAGIMLLYGIRGTFYPNAYRLQECHKKIHKKLEVGSHGTTHDNATELKDERIKEFVSKKPFEAFLEDGIRMFSYPWGFHNEATLSALKEEGYLGARLTKVDPSFSHPMDFFKMEISMTTGKIPGFEDFRANFDGFLKKDHGVFHLLTHCAGTGDFSDFERICQHVRKSKIESLTNSEIIGI